jgi:Fe-S cluster biogenesis protein NfuA
VLFGIIDGFFNFRRYKMTLEEQVKAMLEALRPMLQQDGGDLEFVSMEGKTVTLRLVGHCGSCPYAMMTLKQGIETKLRELDPELTVERAL